MKTKVPNEPGWIRRLNDHREQCTGMWKILGQVEAEYRAGNNIEPLLSQIQVSLLAIQAGADALHEIMVAGPLRHMFSADRLNITEQQYPVEFQSYTDKTRPDLATQRLGKEVRYEDHKMRPQKKNKACVSGTEHRPTLPSLASAQNAPTPPAGCPLPHFPRSRKTGASDPGADQGRTARRYASPGRRAICRHHAAVAIAGGGQPTSAAGQSQASMAGTRDCAAVSPHGREMDDGHLFALSQPWLSRGPSKKRGGRNRQ